MAKKHQESAAATLEEIQSRGDRLAEWMAANPAILLGTAVAILVLAGGYGLFTSLRTDSLEAASAALAKVDTEYREAMGAAPESLEIVEPANPETARTARTTFVARYREVAEAHQGTLVEALAWLQVGNLTAQLGQPEEAIGILTEAAGRLDSQDMSRALLLSRIAAEQEAGGDWLAAAEAYEEAGGVLAYPLRHAALADAARCLAEAGERERALQVFDRIEAEAPGYRMSDVTRATLMELRAVSAAPADVEAPAEP